MRIAMIQMASASGDVERNISRAFSMMEEAAEKIGQVTVEEVRAFVHKHFDLSQMSLSLVGDLKKLPREEMEELWMTYRTEKA